MGIGEKSHLKKKKPGLTRVIGRPSGSTGFGWVVAPTGPLTNPN
jgi:hypothetical protein